MPVNQDTNVIAEKTRQRKHGAFGAGMRRALWVGMARINRISEYSFEVESPFMARFTNEYGRTEDGYIASPHEAIVIAGLTGASVDVYCEDRIVFTADASGGWRFVGIAEARKAL